ncbi:hypothetical protein [Flavobacterium gilvum]|uniref:Uncharacterized protein n=1 Tax=Flavobacterium gilvum TaxID=1492737 RepID=A0AAC9N4B7_9FLAO|nr:hypothetical protein [Flavobacterium gilvum]AOW10465.1 hypothetical protein EM308_13665 [Flavobacterium gilvum]KFC61158.1 hypothetical protein FEM08_00940 [Flavobacterium gilvum]
MKISRINFVCIFLIFGFAYLLGSILILDQMPEALFASELQESWQATVSTILCPIKIILIGPLIPVINFLHKDPDTPPLFFIVCFIVYWTILALAIYYFFNKEKRTKQT